MKGKANRVERTPSDKNAEDLISDRSPGQGLCSPPIPEVCRTGGGGEKSGQVEPTTKSATVWAVRQRPPTPVPMSGRNEMEAKRQLCTK